MKRQLLTAVVLFLFSFTNAQKNFTKPQFGIKGGLNFATLTGLSEAKFLFGANAGLFIEFKINDKLVLQPEALFSMQGATSSISRNPVGANGSYTEEEKLALNYLVIPVMAKFYVSKKFTLQAGPQLGFLINATGTTKVSSTIPNYNQLTSPVVVDGDLYLPAGETKMDFKPFVNDVDFAFNIGTGYNINEKICVDLRYNLGITKISRVSTPIASKNSVFMINIGYKF